MLSRLQDIISTASGRLPANVAVRLDRAPLCTFTFDDCPRSSLEAGGRILEHRGLAGTFFVCGGTFGAGEQEPMLAASDLESLIRRGHELGCHTYSHTSVRSTSIARLREDLDHNREVLLAASGAESLVSFAYPFGRTNHAAKVEIARRFAAARGIRPGVNGRILDMAELLAVRLYAWDFKAERIRAFIERAADSCGWLIFYTHDVRDSPSSVGCTAEQFNSVVQMVVDSQMEVLPMRSAVGRMMHRA